MNKHTPGPWTAEPPSERECRRCWTIWPTDASGHVAHITQSSRDESNARLIAAAPGLLAAVRGLLDDRCRRSWKYRKAAYRYAEDVLRAAEGEG